MSNPAYVTDLIDDATAAQYNDALDFARRNMLDYKIVATVATNDLTVALKHADGTDPSTTDPLIFKIGDTYRTISAALSITIADGTNWFNAGAPELGGQLTGHFVYLVWDSNSSVVALTISRIPWAAVVSSFSATTTNEKHCYNYANFTTTDDVINIGYFEATLSLVATSYLWTVPTFTGANLINRPTFQTRRLTFTPIFTNLTVGNGTLTASYVLKMDVLKYALRFIFGTTSSISGDVTFTLPFTMAVNAYPCNNNVILLDTGTAQYFGALTISSTTANKITVRNTSTTYETLSVLSSTVPFTWVTTDELAVTQAEYFVQ